MTKITNFAGFLLIIGAAFILSACSACNSGAYEEESHSASNEQHEENNQGNEPQNLHTISFNPTDAIRQAQGLLYYAEISGRTYFLMEDNFDLGVDFVEVNEKLIQEISSFASIGTPPFQFSLTSDENNFGIRGMNTVFNHENANTKGWLVHIWTSGRIPMWLSAGMEVVALSNLGLFEPSDIIYIPQNFGDLLLMPSNWGTQEQAQGIDAAYHFVRHLINTQAFDEIINLLVAGDDDAHEKLSAYFADFSGGEQLSGFEYVLFTLDSGGAYSIRKSTDLANYHFIFDDFSQHLDIETIVLYVEYSEDGIEFVYNWYSQFFDFEFVPIHRFQFFYNPHPLHYGVGGDIGRDLVRIFNLGRRDIAPFFVIVHEITHALEVQVFGSLSHPSFSQGLAEALEYLHHIYDHHRGGFGFYYELLTAPLEDENAVNGLRENLYIIYGTHYAADHFIENFIIGFDPMSIAHHRAYQVIYRHETLPNPEAMSVAPLFGDEISPYLSSYVTSHSFVMWLMETYGHENYARVHFDIHYFEDVYGVTITEMVDRWLGFLRDFADGVRGQAH
ncbi:MAG: hypothetical protein FWB98_06950 [Defluviitaleaceae bacterium]|nr:hypothetical protein [Defluviitaleaceae bacterium]